MQDWDDIFGGKVILFFTITTYLQFNINHWSTKHHFFLSVHLSLAQFNYIKITELDFLFLEIGLGVDVINKFSLSIIILCLNKAPDWMLLVTWLVFANLSALFLSSIVRKYHCTTDLLFGFSCFVFCQIVTDLLVWSYPNRR